MSRAGVSECVRIAATQHGVISRAQALASGVSAGTIQRLVSDGSWARVRPNVFAAWTPSSESELWCHRLKATELWLGAESAVSHRASVMTWELDGLDFAPLEFSTTRNRRSQTAGLIIHRVTALPPQHISVVAGLRVTSVPRTLVDLGAVVPAEILELALESALRRHLTTRDEMRAALEWSSPTQAGKGMLRRLLDDDFTTATESALETLAWQVFRDEGLPLPARQYEVRDQRKRFVARVDFAYPEARLALEVDGYEHHSSRKDWRRDRRRQNALIRLGWTVYRVTWEDIMHRGHVVADDLRGLLAGSLAKFVR